jgi:hypothetical protein
LRHRHDGTTLLGLLAVVFGLAWLVAGTHVAHVSTEAVIAIALMVLGGAMVVTARTDWALSRRTWPLIGGGALALALLALSASPSLPVGFRHLEVGSRTITASTWAQVPSSVHGGFGRTVLDLTRIEEPLAAPRTVVVDGAAGRLEIDLPPNLKVILDASTVAGEIKVNGVSTSGLRRVDNETLNASSPGPALTLDVVAGFGSVEVIQAPDGVKTPTPPAAAAAAFAGALGKAGALPMPKALPGGPFAPSAPVTPRAASVR